jgi:hypothetical protein
MGKDTVCRIEERKHPNISPREFINDVFNPFERVEKQIAEQGRELSEIRSIVTELLKEQKNHC